MLLVYFVLSQVLATSWLLFGAPSPTGMSGEGAVLTWRVGRGKEDAAGLIFLWLKFEDVTSAALGSGL